jgi:hypothetical protein
MHSLPSHVVLIQKIFAINMMVHACEFMLPRITSNRHYHQEDMHMHINIYNIIIIKYAPAFPQFPQKLASLCALWPHD